MPYLKLNTNLNISDSSDLLKDLSALMAAQTGKPERYVMVEVNSGLALLFAGSNEPAAYLECKSIGLNLAQTKPLSSALAQLLKKRLNIEPSRMYIEFQDAPASFWGWNGSTFG